MFGWIPGEVKKLDTNRMKLPHMGNIPYGVKLEEYQVYLIIYEKMYFCHTFAFNCAKEYVIAETNYEQNLFLQSIKKTYMEFSVIQKRV